MGYFNLGTYFANKLSLWAERPALRFEKGDISFLELEEKSNQFARQLESEGVEKGDVIAIFNDKSLEAFSLMLGCLKVGAVYTNLDFLSPVERLRKIVERCKPKRYFSDSIDDRILTEIKRGLGIDPILLSEFKTTSESQENRQPESNRWVHGSDPAYIMFTSGSTGFPKGAVMSHQNLLNFVQWAGDQFDLGDGEVLSNVNPIYFDNSVFDFYCSIFNGACMLPVRAELTRKPQDLIKFLEAGGCTSWFSVPSLLVYLLTTRSLGKDNLPDLKRFIFGGEGFPKPKLKELFSIFGKRSRLFNVYGPTECTCICSCYEVTENDFKDLNQLAPLGFLTPLFDFELLKDGKSKGEGELCLRGPNVGLGYYNDKERTEGSFIQNPFNHSYSDQMYKTGDLVKTDQKGMLHFLGRVDNQIKHMGYRIELEEIESALNTHDLVEECGIVYQELGNGMGQIIGFVGSTDHPEEKELLGHLKNLVPDYMVPKRVKVLESLPKNSNGKIDRNALKSIIQK